MVIYEIDAAVAFDLLKSWSQLDRSCGGLGRGFRV
jgi:hypothetical protein